MDEKDIKELCDIDVFDELLDTLISVTEAGFNDGIKSTRQLLHDIFVAVSKAAQVQP